MSWFEFPNLSKVVICVTNQPAWPTCSHKAHPILKTQEPRWGAERLWTSSPLENVSHGGAHRYFGRGREDKCSWSWKMWAGSPVCALDKGEEREIKIKTTGCLKQPVYYLYTTPSDHLPVVWRESWLWQGWWRCWRPGNCSEVSFSSWDTVSPYKFCKNMIMVLCGHCAALWLSSLENQKS